MINTNDIVQDYLPKQTDIYKILKIIKGYPSPCNSKGDTNGISKQSIFQRHIHVLSTRQITKFWECYMQNWGSSRKVYVTRFIIIQTETALLIIPETCADKIITLYHWSLSVGHQSVMRTCQTITDTFFIPDLVHYLCSYIKGCDIYQLTRKDKTPTRQL